MPINGTPTTRLRGVGSVFTQDYSTSVCMYVCMYVCVYVSTCVYVCTYTDRILVPALGVWDQLLLLSSLLSACAIRARCRATNLGASPQGSAGCFVLILVGQCSRIIKAEGWSLAGSSG